MRRNPDRHELSTHQRNRTTLAGPALAHVASDAASRRRVTLMGKWHLTLMGVGAVLAATVIVWLGSGGISYSGTTHAVSTERKDGEASYDNNDSRAMEANRHFMERARAIEAGFKAAFLFHE